MLPGRDGLSVVRELRARGSDAPVLALTARGTLEDRIAGLDSGCDDYLPKPFAFEELLARLRALRRPGHVLTRTTLLENVWGYDFDSTSNVLEVYMNFLRKKIDHGFPRKLLHTVQGDGYVLREEEE